MVIILKLNSVVKNITTDAINTVNDIVNINACNISATRYGIYLQKQGCLADVNGCIFNSGTVGIYVKDNNIKPSVTSCIFNNTNGIGISSPNSLTNVGAVCVSFCSFFGTNDIAGAIRNNIKPLNNKVVITSAFA